MKSKKQKRDLNHFNVYTILSISISYDNNNINHKWILCTRLNWGANNDVLCCLIEASTNW